MLPKIKDIVLKTYVDNKIILKNQDLSIEIEDEEGEIGKLLKLLSGKFSIEDIYNKTTLSKEDVDELISVLDENLLVEDYELDNDLLSKDEKERYKTNLNYLSNYSNLNTSKYYYQKNIMNSTVVLIGVGGASLLGVALAAMGVKKLILVDYDKVEVSNLSRQILYFENDIGRFKVEAAKEKIKASNSSVDVQIYNRKIACVSDVEDIIKDADIVVNAIDTPPIESARWLNYVCVKNNKILIQGSVGQDCVIIEKYGGDKGCYDCFLISGFKESNEFEETIKYQYTKEYKDVNTSYIPNIMILIGMLSSEIGKIIGKYGEPMDADYSIEFNTKTLQLNYINKTKRVDNCPTCGSRKKSDKLANISELINIGRELKEDEQ